MHMRIRANMDFLSELFIHINDNEFNSIEVANMMSFANRDCYGLFRTFNREGILNVIKKTRANGIDYKFSQKALDYYAHFKHSK